MAVPVATPVTTPDALTFATLLLLLLQLPPDVAQLSVLVEPIQIVVVPVIATGVGFTVIVFVAIQPSQVVKLITAVPAATPVTVPDPAATAGPPAVTVATAVLLLLQLPQDELIE